MTTVPIEAVLTRASFVLSHKDQHEATYARGSEQAYVQTAGWRHEQDVTAWSWSVAAGHSAGELAGLLGTPSLNGSKFTVTKDKIGIKLIRSVLNIETAADDPMIVRDVQLLHPELSRGELADVFSAAADKVRTSDYARVVVGGRRLPDTFDDAAWNLLSRDDWPPPPEPEDPADPCPF